MDAYVLGRNLGELQWIFFGCTTALYINRLNDHAAQRPEPGGPSPAGQQGTTRKSLLNQLVYLLIGAITWLIISVISVSFITINAVLSICIAVMGGAFLGIFLVNGFELLYKNGTIQPLLRFSQPAA